MGLIASDIWSLPDLCSKNWMTITVTTYHQRKTGYSECPYGTATPYFASSAGVSLNTYSFILMQVASFSTKIIGTSQGLSQWYPLRNQLSSTAVSARAHAYIHTHVTYMTYTYIDTLHYIHIIHTHTYIHIYIYWPIGIHTYTCTHTFLHIHTYICIYIYRPILKQLNHQSNTFIVRFMKCIILFTLFCMERVHTTNCNCV